MKSKSVMLGLVLMTAMMLATLSCAKATDYFPLLTASNQGVVWQFDTMKFFSGKLVDPDTVVAIYWATDPAGVGIEVTPYKISLTDSQVKLWFNTADLPRSAVKNNVEGSLTTGETFVATGLGWAMGGHF